MARRSAARPSARPEDVRIRALAASPSVAVGGAEVALTETERKLLTLLVARGLKRHVGPGRRLQQVSRDELEEALAEMGGVPASLRTHLGNLRSKVGGREVLPEKTSTGWAFADGVQSDASDYMSFVRESRASTSNSHFALGSLRAAAALWPYDASEAEFSYSATLSGFYEDLRELRSNADAVRFRLELDAGNARDIVGELNTIVRNPYRALDDGLWLLYIEARWLAAGTRAGAAACDDAAGVYRAEGLPVPREFLALRSRILDVAPIDQVEALDRQEGEGQPVLVSTTSLPATTNHLVGRVPQLARLDKAWSEGRCNVLEVVAWAGVGKTSLINDWLGRLRIDRYRGARRVFAWSFYRQGRESPAVSGDLFVETALRWFGDPDPSSGSSWERGKRLAQAVASVRTLLILDGLEPLQYALGETAGRLRDPALASLLGGLAESNPGLVVVTSRSAIADLAHLDGDDVVILELAHLSPDEGAQLLQSLGAIGEFPQLKQASLDYGNHPLALTLLGSYVEDAYGGDIKRRGEIRTLEADIRHGGHAQRVLSSYQEWFGPGPHVETLELLGLFDRPVDQAVLQSISDGDDGAAPACAQLSTEEWRRVFSRLRRAGLLLQRDPYRPELLDVHPLVREHFRESFRHGDPSRWQTGNKRLFSHFSQQSAPFPETLEQMEPLFRAVAHGCEADEHDRALELYRTRIMQGDDWFAANDLGAYSSLISALSNFFVDRNFGTPVVGLTRDDRLLVLLESATYLSALRGYAATEVGRCYDQALRVAIQLRRPSQVVQAQLGLLRFHRFRGHLSEALSLAYEVLRASEVASAPVRERAPALRELASTLFYVGEFQQTLKRSVEGMVCSHESHLSTEMARLNVNDPFIISKGYASLAEWFLGLSDDAIVHAQEAVALARGLRHPHTLVVAVLIRTMVHQLRSEHELTYRSACELSALSVKFGFLQWNTAGQIFQEWSRLSRVDSPTDHSRMQNLLTAWVGGDARLFAPYFFGLLADSTKGEGGVRNQALDSAFYYSGTNEERWWDAELHRMRAVDQARAGEQSAAIATARKAVAIAERQEALFLHLRSLVELSRIVLTASDKRLTRVGIREVLSRTSGAETTWDVIEARRVLVDP